MWLLVLGAATALCLLNLTAVIAVRGAAAPGVARVAYGEPLSAAGTAPVVPASVVRVSVVRPSAVVPTAEDGLGRPARCGDCLPETTVDAKIASPPLPMLTPAGARHHRSGERAEIPDTSLRGGRNLILVEPIVRPD